MYFSFFQANKIVQGSVTIQSGSERNKKLFEAINVSIRFLDLFFSPGNDFRKFGNKHDYKYA